MPASRLIDLPKFSDLRGTLVVFESGEHVPFDVRRSFFVYGVPATIERGEHAHRRCHQFLVCACGTVKARTDDGKNQSIFELNSPTKGLYMPPMTWGGQFDYSVDAVLAVFASHPYDHSDYIRDYTTFLKLVVVN